MLSVNYPSVRVDSRLLVIAVWVPPAAPAGCLPLACGPGTSNIRRGSLTGYYVFNRDVCRRKPLR